MIDAIQPFLAPAIMISAGALLSIPQFARYTAIINLIRNLNLERLAIFQEMDQEIPEIRELMSDHSSGLEHQVSKILTHAAMVKNALSFLLGGILMMLLCSLTIGASLVFNPLEIVALVLFVGGLASMLVGLGLLLAELRVSLQAIEFEHGNLNRLRRGKGLLPPELKSRYGVGQKLNIE